MCLLIVLAGLKATRMMMYSPFDIPHSTPPCGRPCSSAPVLNVSKTHHVVITGQQCPQCYLLPPVFRISSMRAIIFSATSGSGHLAILASTIS